MDFVESLPSSSGYESMLKVVDHLSKSAKFFLIKHTFTTETVAQIFVENVVKLHGNQIIL